VFESGSLQRWFALIFVSLYLEMAVGLSKVDGERSIGYSSSAEKISLVLSCLGVQGRNKCVDLYVLRCWNVLVVAAERDEEVDFSVFQEVIMTSIARKWGTELYSSPS
jgi:hypothetical protein